MLAPGWILRPVVWFAAASMMTTIVHELTHACAAYLLGVRSTLFNYSVDLDLTEAQAATSAPALIAIAGPLAALALGVLAWLAYRRARASAAALPLIYLSVFGIGTFFGNLMSISFVGDFSAAANSLRIPMTVRYAMSLIGVLSVAAVHFWAGRALTRWAPATAGRMTGMLGMVALPAVLGTAVVILANLPMPQASVTSRVAEASFWLFAAIAALVAQRHPGGSRQPLGLRWADGVAAVLALLAVRLMVPGIPFVP